MCIKVDWVLEKCAHNSHMLVMGNVNDWGSNQKVDYFGQKDEIIDKKRGNTKIKIIFCLNNSNSGGSNADDLLKLLCK